MFTGIVSDIGEIIDITARGAELARVRIACAYARETIDIGASIACAGVCLTVVETGREGNRTWFAADAAAETMRVTKAGAWARGTRLNLERALKMGDELGGHIVTGHVDGLATLLARRDLTDMAQLTLRAPADLARFIAAKGSVALDGVSLTVNTVEGDVFSVLVIPHTLQVTTLADWHENDSVHLEVDLMARYAARLMNPQ